MLRMHSERASEESNGAGRPAPGYGNHPDKLKLGCAFVCWCELGNREDRSTANTTSDASSRVAGPAITGAASSAHFLPSLPLP